MPPRPEAPRPVRWGRFPESGFAPGERVVWDDGEEVREGHYRCPSTTRRGAGLSVVVADGDTIALVPHERLSRPEELDLDGRRS